MLRFQGNNNGERIWSMRPILLSLSHYLSISLYLSLPLSRSLSLYLFIHLSISVYLSLSRPLGCSIYPSIRLSISHYLSTLSLVFFFLLNARHPNSRPLNFTFSTPHCLSNNTPCCKTVNLVSCVRE